MAQPLTKQEIAEVNEALAPRKLDEIIGSRQECVQPELSDPAVVRGRALTARQRRVLDFIREYTRREGAPPSLREIGKAMGIRSTNGVNDHLRALERKGCIRRRDMLSRSIVIIGTDAAPPTTPIEQWREENRALRVLLQRMHDAVSAYPHISPAMAVVLGDVRAVLRGQPS